MHSHVIKNHFTKLKIVVLLSLFLIVSLALWVAFNFNSVKKTISSAEIQEHTNISSTNKSDIKTSVPGKESEAPDIKSQVAHFAERLHAIQSPETEQLISKGDALVKDADHLLLKMVANKQSSKNHNSESPAAPK